MERKSEIETGRLGAIVNGLPREINYAQFYVAGNLASTALNIIKTDIIPSGH